jgi:hypothetical protein
MIKHYYDIIQGSNEWINLRLGILTGSTMIRIITPTLKIADNDDSRDLLFELLAQRVTNYVEPAYINDNMLRGEQEEIYARECYSKNYAPIKECGFITNDELGFTLGFSPDGLVGDDGITETKSRRQSFHIKNIIEDVAEKKTMIQIQTGLFVTKRKWCDFISYCGGLPMFVKRVEVDEKYQEAIKLAAIGFENRVNELMGQYVNKSLNLIPTERKIIQEMI